MAQFDKLFKVSVSFRNAKGKAPPTRLPAQKRLVLEEEATPTEREANVKP